MDILIAAVILTGLGVLAVLVLVLAGIDNEDRHMSLTRTPSHPHRSDHPPAAPGVGVRTQDPAPATTRFLPERSAMTVSDPARPFPGQPEPSRIGPAAS